MISTGESVFIENNAYIPEHIAGYVTAVSGGEPHLFGSYLCYVVKETLIFVGYPLGEVFDTKSMQTAIMNAGERLKPSEIALIAPDLPQALQYRDRDSDSYYRLDIGDLRIPSKTGNMIKRAKREITIEKTKEYSRENMQLVEEFLGSHVVSDGTKFIFGQIPSYVAAVNTAFVINGRDSKGRLVAFDIADFHSRDYAFYMFNFISEQRYVPGTADALLHEVIKTAREEGKRYINLGLGINKGVSFFKLKWGGVPFLNYEYGVYHRKRNLLGTLLKKLSA